MKPASERNEDEAGAALLMSACLEMYEHWQRAKPGAEPPSQRIHVAAQTCVQMRDQMQMLDWNEWSEETEGLFHMMTAFMYLFKHMYVPQNQSGRLIIEQVWPGKLCLGFLFF